MILPKQDCIPSVTSGGLDTVGIRMPSHPIARRLITLSKTAIAAPSGNRSGYPSPTTAAHMMHDLNGKIAAVIDGGACQVGVESTVICFEDAQTVRILRPGYITKEDLEQVANSARYTGWADGSFSGDEIPALFSAGKCDFSRGQRCCILCVCFPASNSGLLCVGI